MPARVDVDGHDVVVTLSGWSGIWSLSGGVRLPLAEVTSASVLTRGELRRAWLRLGGTEVPKVIKAGRFWSPKGGREFWFARKADRLLVVETTGKYRRVVVETKDPESDAARILAAR